MALQPKVYFSRFHLIQLLYTSIFLVIVLFRFYYLEGDAADSALFENISILGSLPQYESEFLKSIQVIIRKFLSSPTESSIYDFPTDSGLDGHLIGAHAYLVMPLISIIAKIFGFKLMTAFVAAAITTLPFFVLVSIVRRTRNVIGVKEHLFAVLILIFYPAVLWSGLGQFYPDRLFMVFFPIFLLLLNALQNYQKKKTRMIFIILAFLSLSVTERGAVYVSVACLVFAFSARKNRLLIIFTGLTSLTWSLLYYKFISTDTYPNSFFDQAKSIEGLTSLLFTVPTFKLILFHLPGFLLMRKMRDLQIFLIICMGPNLIGNIGGAEKIGWVTHYMSYLAASYIGVILVYVSRVLNKNFETKKMVGDKEYNQFGSRVSQHLVTIAPVLACMLFLFVNPNSSTKVLGTSAAEHSGIFGKSSQWIYQGANTIEYKSFQKRKEYLAKTLPKNARVGISEGTAKYVSDRFKNIYMFPAGIEKLDFAVLKSSVGELGTYRQDPIINYSNPESGVQLSEEIQAMLLGKCFQDITPKEYYPLHIFQRVPTFKLDESCTRSD